jgi:NAD(P)-dependent dehydrogenase (short-subunit alcohol dehydrogenase family)
MEKAIFITGASSGIGKATAALFAERGWKVIATMRDPAKASFAALPNVSVLRLDVTDPVSIKSAVAEAVRISPRIDVLVNNAGYALRGIFEGYTRDQMEAQFRTNVFGLMDVIKEFIPLFKKQMDGTIVNVSSAGGRIGFPLYSLYQASKFAVEGFTESLAYELEGFGIRLRLVEPGFIITDFHTRSMERTDDKAFAEYGEFVAAALRRNASMEKRGSSPELAARVIYEAATRRGKKFRFPAGADARLALALRSALPFRLFRAIFRKALLG